MQPQKHLRQIPTDPDALLSEAEVSELFGISMRTLQAWRTKKSGPPFARLGRVVRYRRKDLIGWAEQNTHYFAI
jgi:predicted DNA-binding transcriptional regulator AlpA